MRRIAFAAHLTRGKIELCAGWAEPVARLCVSSIQHLGDGLLTGRERVLQGCGLELFLHGLKGLDLHHGLMGEFLLVVTAPTTSFTPMARTRDATATAAPTMA